MCSRGQRQARLCTRIQYPHGVLLAQWLMLDGLRVRGLAKVIINVTLNIISMIAVAVSAVRLGSLGLGRCIKCFVE